MLSEREQWEVQSKAFPAHSIQQDEEFLFLDAISEKRKKTYREPKRTDVIYILGAISMRLRLRRFIGLFENFIVYQFHIKEEVPRNQGK